MQQKAGEQIVAQSSQRNTKLFKWHNQAKASNEPWTKF